MMHEQKTAEKILWGILIIQIGFVTFLNFKMGPELINFDLANLYVHMIEIWKNHTILIPGWSYSTTMEVDCTAFLALPFYGITKNIYLASGIANLIMCIVYVWVIFQMFDEKQSRICPLLFSIMILMPYRTGMLDYFDMMFFNGGQYSFKVLIPLVLTALFSRLRSEKIKNKSTLILSVMYGLSLIWTAFSSGIYVFVCGVAGVFLFYGLIYIIYHESFEKEYGILLAGSVLCTLVGMAGRYFVNVSVRETGMNLCHIVGQLRENIVSCIIGIFELFNGVVYFDKAVASPRGLEVCVRIVFVAAIFASMIYTMAEILKRREKLQMCCLTGIFLWNFFILCICNTKYGAYTFEYRYHIIGLVPLFGVFSFNMARWLERSKMRREVYGLICFIAALGIMFDVSVIFQMKDIRNRSLDDYRSICEFAVENEAGMVYFMDGKSEPAEICRLLDSEHAVYVDFGGGRMIPPGFMIIMTSITV